MTDTHKPTSQMASTTRIATARFALQMAEQAKRFGGRVAELRERKGWKQRELVARMAALGDQSINTNQLSRYENGGAMPGEQRQQQFAEALETTVADLHAGPEDERQPKRTGDPFDAINGSAAGSAPGAQVAELRSEMAEVRAELSEVRTDLQHVLSLLRRGGRDRGEEGTPPTS